MERQTHQSVRPLTQFAFTANHKTAFATNLYIVRGICYTGLGQLDRSARKCSLKVLVTKEMCGVKLVGGVCRFKKYMALLQLFQE